MMLEQLGFKFIETVYQPELNLLKLQPQESQPALHVQRATSSDLPDVLEIAGSAFANERFHVDPRIGPDIGNQRYQNWAANALEHDTQRLDVVRDGDIIVAFFVTEILDDGTCYWHLNAVAPECQGRGYGRRVWNAMLEEARQHGASRVKTSVVARNFRVMNLYAQLGFRLSAPKMTFHWIHEK